MLRDKLRDEIVYRCKHRSIQRVRHQRVHDRKHRCATSDKHCQQLIVNACRNHRERGIEVGLRASPGGVYTWRQSRLLPIRSTLLPVLADTVNLVATVYIRGQSDTVDFKVYRVVLNSTL